MQPDLILVPFAQNAPAVNVDAIPVNLDPSDPPQAASWSQGFPTVTMTPLAAGGIPPRGQSFNGVLQDITQHLVYIGGGGQYKWSSDYVAAKGGYSIGDVIQADSGLLSYVSLVNNNTDNFNTTPASIGPKWRAWAGAPIPDATTTQRGAVLLATQSQVNAGTGDAVLTPATRAGASQIQASCAFATSGTSTAQVLTPSPAIAAYAANQRFNVTFNVASGANPTINVSGLGVKNLKQYGPSGAKISAVYAASQNGDIVYDGTDWVLLDTLPVDAMPVVGGPYRPTFNSLGISNTAGGMIAQQGGYIGWNLSNLGEMHFICNRGAGVGGFTWRSVNANNTQTGPEMTYSYGGQLNVPLELSVPTITSNTIVPTQGFGYTGTYIANCAFVAAAVANRVIGDAVTTLGISGGDATKPFVTQAGTGTNILLSTPLTTLGNNAYQDLTASRSSGTSYTNNTSRPIAVSVITAVSQAWTLSASVGGIEVARQVSNNMTAGGQGTLQVIVPAGASYSFTVTTATISKWLEAR